MTTAFSSALALSTRSLSSTTAAWCGTHKQFSSPSVPASFRMVQTPTRTNKKTKTHTTSTPPEEKTAAVQIPSIVVLGLSHHTATVDVREQLSIPEHEWQTAAKELLLLDGVREAAILSTCNRFEVYLVTTEPYIAIQQVVSHLSSRKSTSKLTIGELRRHLFMLIGNDAIWHLLRVSSGLDSLVVGEGQILSQVKKCYELSTEKKLGGAGKILSRFLNIAVSAGKRVRNETEINKGAVSISSAAVELVWMKLDEHKLPEQPEISIIGAGKMSRLLVQHLSSKGINRINIINRSRERVEELQKQFPDVHLELYLMDELIAGIKSADVVFTSTASEEPILTKASLKDLPVVTDKMIVDISVPRNVSDDVEEIKGLYAYNVDDLKAVVAKNQAKRKKLMLEAEKLLKEEQATFNNWLHSLGCVPCISKLQSRAECIRQDEMDKYKGKLAGLSPSELKAVEALSKGIINKMLHSPMVHLRGLQDMEERSQTLRNIEALFKL